MAETDGMHKGPESPRTPQCRPLGGPNIPEGIGRILTGQGTNNGGISGIEKDGPDRQIGGDLDAGGPPRPTKVQIGFHKGQPVVTQGAVDHESGGTAAEGTGQIERPQRLALINLRDEVTQPVRDAAGAGLVEDGIVGNERFVRMDEVEGEAGQRVDRDGEFGHVCWMWAEVVLPQRHESLDVRVSELVNGRQGDEAHDGGIGVKNVVDGGGTLILVGHGHLHGRPTGTLQVELLKILIPVAVCVGKVIGWFIGEI